MNEAKVARDDYIGQLDTAVDYAIQKLDLKKKIKQSADAITVEIVKQMCQNNPGTYPLEVLKSLLIIVWGEKKKYEWFKVQMMLE